MMEQPGASPTIIDQDRLLDVHEVAARLNVPKSWVYANAESGVLPSLRIGKYRRFSRAAIEGWLLKQQDARSI